MRNQENRTAVPWEQKASRHGPVGREIRPRKWAEATLHGTSLQEDGDPDLSSNQSTAPPRLQACRSGLGEQEHPRKGKKKTTKERAYI